MMAVPVFCAFIGFILWSLCRAATRGDDIKNLPGRDSGKCQARKPARKIHGEEKA